MAEAGGRTGYYGNSGCGKDIRPLAEQCMEFGAKVLLIKCGVPGMYLRTADKNSLEKTGSKAELSADVWSEKEILRKAIYRTEYVPGQEQEIRALQHF